MNPQSDASGLGMHHEYLLLATHDERGTLRGWHDFGMAGAVLMELALSGHIELGGRRIRAVGQRPADVLLAPVWDRIQAKPGKKADHWVGKIAWRPRAMRDLAYTQLVAAGIVRRDERRVLGLIPRTVYLQQRPEVERMIRARLDAALDTDVPDQRDGCLACLVVSSEISSLVFPKDRRRLARRTVKRWLKDDVLGKAVADAVVAVTVAIIVAVSASTSAAASG